MSEPKELSLAEIRNFMLANNGKVTNHALVKYFKRFLTNQETQSEARKEFKNYVNILATIKNENNQKFLLLRKKYENECPTTSIPGSPGSSSILSESILESPYRQPPPYKPPPGVATTPKALPNNNNVPLNTGEKQNSAKKLEAVTSHHEKKQTDLQSSSSIPVSINQKEHAPKIMKIKSVDVPEKVFSQERDISHSNSIDEQQQPNKENIPRFSFSSASSSVTSSDNQEKEKKMSDPESDIAENPISVREATRKFNRMASVEEAKVLSPPISSKRKTEKQPPDEKPLTEVTFSHPKAKEWIVSMAKGDYHILVKLLNLHPELVKLQDPATGYTALHWAAKHGNKDIIQLIAGTYKADVNARTNGGYTPLHLAVQFERHNVFEILCNVYKANRDLMDWSGNKPLDYTKQRTSVSASTYSKIKAKRKDTAEKDLGFLRIGSLNVRVKKTTEAFSNFLGVGNGNTISPMETGSSHQRSHRHRHHHHPRLQHAGMIRTTQLHGHPMTKRNIPSEANKKAPIRSSAPINNKIFNAVHKSWGSADNINHNNETTSMMPPPPPLKLADPIKRRQEGNPKNMQDSNSLKSQRGSMSSSNSSTNLNSAGYSSMPTTPNQLRSSIIDYKINNANNDSDSNDSACGFGSNWDTCVLLISYSINYKLIYI